MKGKPRTMIILKTKWKDCKSCKNSVRKMLCTRKKFTYTELSPWSYQKFAYWKTQTKHVSQTTAI